MRSYIGMTLLVATASLAGCLDAPAPATDDSAPANVSVADRADADDPAASEAPPANCHQHFEVDMTGTNGNVDDFKPAASCPADIYFHPDNGQPGGWIEAWRICGSLPGTVQICTGGYAPVRPYNPSSCNGTVYYNYPQGWHGYAQTAGGCC